MQKLVLSKIEGSKACPKFFSRVYPEQSRRNQDKLRRRVKIAENLIFVFLVAISGLILVTTFIGPAKLQILTVSSGSMAPAVPVGSLIFDLPKDEYRPGEIITFRLRDGNFESEALVTHRIVDVIKSDGGVFYKTKGDRNDSVDLDLVTQDQIVGRVIFLLPWLGRIVLFSQTASGFFLLVIFPAAVIVYREILSLLADCF